ncbi:MAG TPA: tRNA 2-thiouridine(34) synthase MnmA [Paludibacteraceae bacterium]|nr:tRNA 2-thiouridine(34) synthase MnmA [Paludibacteraceae bacterium]HOU67826.1 tRNA 2-thiouridine(34) synthase MnmA [Paludibacteraceae bacterium]HQF49776.1 tRNA 2-thiouridine(34) synthase MnmA [Paludibacteraceae bacterium]HQJ89904.1 tRNA 2-thiouridine(34) synthase MnmA [Paludibacteraceae bacterium]
MSERKRVLIAMSGGVDSSTVCMLLQEQGYEIEGITMRMWDAPKNFEKYGESLPDYIIDAQNLAKKLNFPHHILDIRDDFKTTVVDYFANEYLNGRTPNPCVVCNRHIKWKYLAEEAQRHNCQYIATGHYAKILHENGHAYIGRGIDRRKDQSYFLWDVSPEILEMAIMPLGDMTKDETKEEATSKGFESLAKKKESMEVCFVDDDYRDFLRQHYSDKLAAIGKGHFVDEEGKKLGEQEGYPFYTIGQRKGLGIALGHPAYVTKINQKKNTVMLGDKSMLETKEMLVENYQIINRADFENPDHVIETQIRYKSHSQRAKIEFVDDEYLIVRFDEPVSAVTPGQSAAFYIGERLLGGGVIADPKALKKAKKWLKKGKEEKEEI